MTDGAIQIYDGKVLVTDGGKIAVNEDCCCVAAYKLTPCGGCTINDILGPRTLTATISGCTADCGCLTTSYMLGINTWGTSVDFNGTWTLGYSSSLTEEFPWYGPPYLPWQEWWYRCGWFKKNIGTVTASYWYEYGKVDCLGTPTGTETFDLHLVVYPELEGGAYYLRARVFFDCHNDPNAANQFYASIDVSDSSAPWEGQSWAGANSENCYPFSTASCDSFPLGQWCDNGSITISVPEGQRCPGSGIPIYTSTDLSDHVGKVVEIDGVCYSVSLNKSDEPSDGDVVIDQACEDCDDCCNDDC